MAGKRFPVPGPPRSSASRRGAVPRAAVQGHGRALAQRPGVRTGSRETPSQTGAGAERQREERGAVRRTARAASGARRVSPCPAGRTDLPARYPLPGQDRATSGRAAENGRPGRWQCPGRDFPALCPLCPLASTDRRLGVRSDVPARLCPIGAQFGEVSQLFATDTKSQHVSTVERRCWLPSAISPATGTETGLASARHFLRFLRCRSVTLNAVQRALVIFSGS